MNPTCNAAAAHLFVVIWNISAVRAVPSPQKYQVFGNPDWRQFADAEKWAREQDPKLGKFVALKLNKPELLAPQIKLPVVIVTQPHVQVLEEESELEVIGAFDSKEYGICWCDAFFRKKGYGSKHFYEILDARISHPESEKWETVDYVPPERINRGRNW